MLSSSEAIADRAIDLLANNGWFYKTFFIERGNLTVDVDAHDAARHRGGEGVGLVGAQFDEFAVGARRALDDGRRGRRRQRRQRRDRKTTAR